MNFELFVCASVWTGSVLFAVFSFVITTKDSPHIFDERDFVEGWFPGTRKDVTDSEWTLLRQTCLKHKLLIIAYIVLSLMVKRFLPKVNLPFVVIFGVLTIVDILSIKALLVISANIFVYYLIVIVGQRILCYAFFIITVICLHSQSFESVQKFVFNGKDETRNFLLEVSMAWLNARCLSFSLDRIHNYSLKRKDFLVSLAYFFYLPCFFTGPLKNYSNFYTCFASDNSARPFNAIHFLFKLIRFIFWALVYDLLLHFVYCSSIQYNQIFITEMNSWSLSGFGYSLPCLFYLKYFVIYGLAGVISTLNGVDLEAPPKCISRIHLCSYLWRHFDRGLHLWLSTYFYKPIVNNKWNVKRKVIATAVCFCCVAVWHGFNKSILVWSFLSFSGVIVELCVTGYLSGFRNIKQKMSKDSQRRLEAVITAPLFMFLILSNIFFLSNFDIGVLFLRTFVFSFSTKLFIALFIMYCSCNVSIFCKRKEESFERSFLKLAKASVR